MPGKEVRVIVTTPISASGTAIWLEVFYPLIREKFSVEAIERGYSKVDIIAGGPISTVYSPTSQPDRD